MGGSFSKLAFSIVLLITGCLADQESTFSEMVQEGPTSISYFFDKKTPKSPHIDPYISSAYRSGDSLYQPILDFQNGRLDKAIPKLKSLSEGGNADAMFWYADFLTRSSIKTRHEGY